MRPEQWEGKIIPAQLSFLAIYSPPLGVTDETFKEQVVFYYSRQSREARSSKKKSKSVEDDGFASREEENEKLRQIGLAQGMVDFARYWALPCLPLQTYCSDCVAAGASQMANR